MISSLMKLECRKSKNGCIGLFDSSQKLRCILPAKRVQQLKIEKLIGCLFDKNKCSTANVLMKEEELLELLHQYIYTLDMHNILEVIMELTTTKELKWQKNLKT